jgi:formylmethanofuran dehydrogenase subunit B
MITITEKLDHKTVRVTKFNDNESEKARQEWVNLHDSMRERGYIVEYWDCGSLHAKAANGSKYHIYYNEK